MPIVFDHVDGVVQRSPESAEGTQEAAGEQQQAPADQRELEEKLENAQRRQRRLAAD